VRVDTHSRATTAALKDYCVAI